MSSSPEVLPAAPELDPGDREVVACVRRDGDRPAHGAGGRARDRDLRRRRVARDRRARLVRRRADVAGRVLGGHPVVVRAGRERRVEVARVGRLCDTVRRIGREARRRRAVDVVASDPDRVRRGAPGEARLGGPAGRGQRARRARRRRVGIGQRLVAIRRRSPPRSARASRCGSRRSRRRRTPSACRRTRRRATCCPSRIPP